MTHPVTHILNLGLTATLSAAAATPPNNVARVYVQTATSSTGKLTLVSGSPFKNTAGLRIVTVSRPL